MVKKLRIAALAVVASVSLSGCTTAGSIALSRVSTMQKIEAAYASLRTTYDVGVAFGLIDRDAQAKVAPIIAKLETAMDALREAHARGDRSGIERGASEVQDMIREVAGADGVVSELDPPPE